MSTGSDLNDDVWRLMADRLAEPEQPQAEHSGVIPKSELIAHVRELLRARGWRDADTVHIDIDFTGAEPVAIVGGLMRWLPVRMVNCE